MMYGHIEKHHDIIQHLLLLRQLQDMTQGFFAFIPWSFKPDNSPLGKIVKNPASESRYLRIIGVARLLLDNFPHIQASWYSEGHKTGQLALEFGADDFGGTLLEENVLTQANYRHQTTLENVINTIHDAGYIPMQRDALYQTINEYDDPHFFQPRVLPQLPNIKAQQSA